MQIPATQICCGLPIFIPVGLPSVRRHIEKNLAMLDRSDIAAVVTDCATCTPALTTGYRSVLNELRLDTAAAARVAPKVKETGAFLAENMETLPSLLNPAPEPVPVTYHSPCHLRNSKAVQDRTAQLLDSLAGMSDRPAAWPRMIALRCSIRSNWLENY